GYRWVAPVEWVGSNGASAHPGQPPPQADSLEALPALGGVFSRKTLFAAGVVLALVMAAFLVFRSGKDSTPPHQLKQRQLTVNSDENPVTGSAFSPDGKSLVYVDLHGLHVKLLATGEIRDVPEPESLKGTDMYWGLGFWSPDSTRVLA